MADHNRESQLQALSQAVGLHKAITDSLKETGGNTADAVDTDWTVFGLIVGGYVAFGAGDVTRISARPGSPFDQAASEQGSSVDSDAMSEKRIAAIADLIRELRSKAVLAQPNGSPARAIVAGLLASGCIEFEGTENVTLKIHIEA